MSAVNEALQTAAVDLGSLLDAGDGAVVTLEVGETRLAAHKSVLAARSPVFEAMFRHDTLESSSGVVRIADMEGPVLRQLVSYCYTLQAPQLPAVAAQLLVAADRYGLSDLKAACEQQLATQLDVENAAASAVLAVRHSCPNLTEAAIAFLRSHNFQVMGTEGWAEVVKNQPHDLIQVSRLLAKPPAKTRTLAAKGRRTTSGNHKDFSQTAASAATIPPPHQTLPLDSYAVTRFRGLSQEKRAVRMRQAAEEGAVGELQDLLAAGVNVDAGDEELLTALHFAAREGHIEAVRCLVECGAQVDARSNLDNTPLHLAAWRGHAAVVQLLVTCSADPNARNQFGKTPLHRAALSGHAETAAVLLEEGADTCMRDEDLNTALDLARESNHQELIEMLT